MIEDGIILKGTRIVIPAWKCGAVVKLMHEGNLGLNKCKLYARETVYWPGLNDQLEKLILNCELCLQYSHLNESRSLHVFRSGDCTTPLDQASDRSISF